MYANDLSILVNEALNSDSYSYILFLPFFAGFLFYLKKDLVVASASLNPTQKRQLPQYFDKLLGVILILTAVIFYWYGSSTFYPLEYHLSSLPIFLAGVVLLLVNRYALRALIFPILFLFFLVPIPSNVLYTAGGAMANFNTQAAYSVLNAANVPVTLSTSNGAPTLLLTTAAGVPTSFSVDLPCSGIYSLIAFVMFGAFFAFVAQSSIFKKLLVFVSGFFVFALLNLLRIIGIISVGYWLGEGTAMFLHSIAGFILIGFGAFMVLIISDKLLKMKIQTRPQEISPCPDCSAKPHKLKAFCESCGRFLGRKNWAFSKKTYATMLLLLLACLVVVQTIQAPTFVTAKGEIEYSSSDVNHEPVNLFPPMSGYQLSYLYRDTAYEKTSGQDLSAMYYYGAKNDTKFSIYADIGVSSSISLLHNWEACLISVQTAKGQDSLVKTLDQREVELLSGSNLVAQFLAFDNTDGTRQVTLYWYEKAAIKTGVSVEQKYVRISLIVLTNQTTSIEEPEKDLFAAGQVIAAKWEPLKSQALISLGVPAQQALLAALSIFFVSAFAVQYFAEQRKISVDTKIFSSYGSAKERIVLAAVKDLSKKNKDLTGAEITEAVQKARGKKVNAKVVQAVLLRLEQNGFVKRKLVSIGNSPKIVWTYRSTE